MQAKIILKTGKDAFVRNFHPWIFSGAIASFPTCGKGELLPVFSHEEELLGWGYFNEQCSLTGRMVSFGEKDPYLALKDSIAKAISLRESLFSEQKTNSFRLIHAEGDFLPGLIVDLYGKILVLQITTFGMERLKDFILDALKEKLPFIEGIYEKSDLSVRDMEGLERKEGVLWGDVPLECEILENGLRYLVDIPEGQKTGFFLDQREMRSCVRELSFQKRVLNGFSYTGAFSVSAACGGAKRVDSVDVSEKALSLSRRNFSLNGLDPNGHGFYRKDVFDFLEKEPLDYDLVILDPPAFAKKREDLPSAIRGYRELHRLAFKKMPATSFLLTCSCSYHVSEESFLALIFQAACESRRQVKILSSHHLAKDHPISLYHREGKYLKSFLLALEGFF
jgi:23S rRNA (cytosine1962-C5)-methyltransferase